MRTYDAFISYSHAQDKPIAAALCTVVQSIGKAWWQRRALRVFRDDASLAASPHLWPDILAALTGTRFLILLASPEAAASPWVGKEIEYWLANKGPHTILIVLTGGTLTWDLTANDFHPAGSDAIPAALLGRFEAEPRWVDLRPFRAGGQQASKRNPEFLTRAADIASALHGVAKEDLLSDELRQQRRALGAAWTAAAGLAGLAAVATWQAYVADQERRRVEQALAQGTATANNLVSNLAGRFAGQKGIPQKFILDILGEARTLVTEFGKIGGDRPELIETQAYALAELSKTLRIQGDSMAAIAQSQATASAAVAAYERLTALAQVKPEWRRGLGASLDRLGDVLRDQGRTEEALTVYRRSLTLAEAETASEDNRAVAHEKIGAILRDRGQWAEALAQFQQTMATREWLLKSAPGRADLQRAVLVSQANIAKALSATGKLSEALAELRGRLARAEVFAIGRPDSNDAQHDLALAAGDLGEALVASGGLQEGRQRLEASLTTLRSLALADPDLGEWQTDLMAMLGRAGDLDLGDGKVASARRNFEDAERIAMRLLAQAPDQADRQEALAVATKKVGDALDAAGDVEAALTTYRRGLALQLRIPASPKVDAAKHLESIGQAFQFVSNLCVETGRMSEAMAVAEQRVAYVTERGADDDGRAGALGSLSWFALFAKDYAKALASAKAAETVRPAELWIKANRAHAEMFSGDAEAARSGYLAHRGKALSPSVTWEQSTLGDFALFRKAGLTHPLMEEIENRFKS